RRRRKTTASRSRKRWPGWRRSGMSSGRKRHGWMRPSRPIWMPWVFQRCVEFGNDLPPKYTQRLISGAAGFLMNTSNTIRFRAGRYLQQPAGYRAFIPAPLPPDPPLDLSGPLRERLSEADHALGRLDGSVLTLPNPDLFVFMYVRKEAVLSSQIEGTQSSLQDLLAAEAQLFEQSLPRDVNEVINYVRAMNHGLARLAELPVSVRLIREIHAELTRGVRGSRLQPGELRTSQNWIGPAGCTLSTATFVPPPHDSVPGALGDLESFLHARDELPPLVKIALAHVQFETIHPFLDGNGRVGRLLITFLLTECRVLHKPVLYLSHYCKQHRQAYYEHLQAVRDQGA